MSEASGYQILRTTEQLLIESGYALIVAVLTIINLAAGASAQAVIPPPQPVVSTIPRDSPQRCRSYLGNTA